MSATKCIYVHGRGCDDGEDGNTRPSFQSRKTRCMRCKIALPVRASDDIVKPDCARQRFFVFFGFFEGGRGSPGSWTFKNDNLIFLR